MTQKKKTPPSVTEIPQTITLKKQAWFERPNVLALLLAAIAALLYAVTYRNEWALDDIISITMNSFTQKGFAGIPDLLSKDSFYGFVGSASELTGGRWRPLALLSFATEIEIFGWKNGGAEANLQLAHYMHFTNIMLYAAIGFLMFKVIARFMIRNIWSAFAITLLFIVHPIHTEVVANIKSRDELLSWFFLLLTLYLSFKSKSSNNILLMPLSLICFFLALLSKENGVTFIAILPITFYCFSDKNWLKSFLATIPFVVVVLFYIGIRFSVMDFVHKDITEIMNAPYLRATGTEAFATKMFVLGKYLVMLFYPHPLSYDYSFNEIPYKNLLDWQVIMSSIVQLALLIYAFLEIRNKNLIAYGILFYFFSIFIASNLLVDTGAPMAERFVFQASFGFLIALVVLIEKLISKLKLNELNRKVISGLLIVLICIPASLKTYARSQEWIRDKVLFVKDVETCPNSARTNNGAGTSYIFYGDDVKGDSLKKISRYDSAIYFLKKASNIHPTYTDPYLNLGVAYDRKKMIDSAEYFWNKARALQPNHPKLTEFDKVLVSDFLDDAAKVYQKGDTSRAISDFRKATKYAPADPKTWYNLAGIYFTTHHYDSARICFDKTLQLDPNHADAKRALNFMNATHR
ncbi:MAG TPA: hypothetical protein DCQ93_02675 [Bacteroidetes bacterium]|nr:hypothetical protein [Bacteroidota bacterium]